jgi:hypothetical protein
MTALVAPCVKGRVAWVEHYLDPCLKSLAHDVSETTKRVSDQLSDYGTGEGHPSARVHVALSASLLPSSACQLCWGRSSGEPD